MSYGFNAGMLNVFCRKRFHQDLWNFHKFYLEQMCLNLAVYINSGVNSVSGPIDVLSINP